MRRRAFGLEVEYDVAFLEFIEDGGGRWVHLSSDRTNIAQRVFLFPSNIFLRNGARLYLDCYKNEYASPECDRIKDVVATAAAGDRRLQALAAAFANGKAVSRLGPGPWRVHVYAGNICNFGGREGEQAYGTHENYQILLPKRRDTESIGAFTKRLHAFMAARQLVFGSGRLRFDMVGQPVFELSQRAGFTWSYEGATTTRARPLINTRDERHADDGSRRWHVICGDHNIREELTAIKFAITALLLTMEEEDRLQGLSLVEPVEATHQISFQPSQRVEVRVESVAYPAWYTPLEILWFYTQQMQDFMEKEGEDEQLGQYKHYLDLWVAHLTRLGEGLEPERHFGELDWATKIVLVQGRMKRHVDIGLLDLSARMADLRQTELSLHEIANPNSTRYKIRRRFPRGTPDPGLVDLYYDHPPPTTRAAVRGACIAWADDSGHKSYEVDWGHFKLPGHSGITLGDPLSSGVPPELTDLLKE